MVLGNEKPIKSCSNKPHAAFSLYIHEEQHNFTYLLRTIEGMDEFIKPLEDIIINTISS